MRRIVLLFISIITALVFCGCQRTPEKAAVINKGEGKLEDIIASSAALPQDIIPEEVSTGEDNDAGEAITYREAWNETYKLPHLTCDIDADLTLPSENEFPVFKVQQRNFDTETVRKIVDYFTENATGVRDTSVTKGELEELLIGAKRGQYITDDNGGRWEPYEGQEEDIKKLENQIAEAEPEVFDPVTDDIILVPMKKTYSMPNDERVYVDADSKDIDMSCIKYGGIQPESWVVAGEAYPGEAVGTTIDNVKINEEEAVDIVKRILLELDIKNLGIAKTEKARIIKDFTYEIVSEGWQITLTRNDGNCIPVYISSSEASGLLQYQAEDYVLRWMPESITIYVDENGVRSFNWQYPIEIAEEMNNNVPIKTFDEIKEIVRDYIKYAFAKKIEGKNVLDQQVRLSKVILTNVLVPIKNDSMYHMIVPAWIVYYEQEDRLGIYTSVLAINAIDGSSIDMTLYPSNE